MFSNVQTLVKDKWLDYYKANRVWLQVMIEEGGHYKKTNDEGRRPYSFLILGAITALSSEVSDIMLPYCQLNTDEDKLVEVLGLDFDPEKELEKREKERTNLQSDTEYLNQFRN